MIIVCLDLGVYAVFVYVYLNCLCLFMCSYVYVCVSMYLCIFMYIYVYLCLLMCMSYGCLRLLNLYCDFCLGQRASKLVIPATGACRKSDDDGSKMKHPCNLI